MNALKFLPKIGFTVLLLGLAKSATGSERVTDYVLAAVIALAALILLFEKVSSKPAWQTIVSAANRLDMTYVAGGLGLMLAGPKLSSDAWVILLFLLAGGCFASYGIGKLIGTGVSDVIKVNAKIGIVLGFILLIAGIIVLILRWDLITDNARNVDMPILLIVIGVATIYVAWRRWRKSQKTTPK